MIPPNKSFSNKYQTFLKSLKIEGELPDKTEVIMPYDRRDVLETIKTFYDRFYGDTGSRTFLIGINPGRFGAGVTGIPFTDPINLEERCGIPNDFSKKHELSSRFIYDLIDSMGGAGSFYSRFFLTAISPLGFTWQGKNRNYYDTPALWKTLKPWIISTFHEQLRTGSQQGYCLLPGTGEKL